MANIPDPDEMPLYINHVLTIAYSEFYASYAPDMDRYSAKIVTRLLQCDSHVFHGYFVAYIALSPPP